MPRRSKRRCRAAAWSSDRVQVDVVRHFARGMIEQMKLDEVALANADKTSGNITAKGPEKILHTVRKFLHHFFHFELHDDFGGVRAFYWWRDIRCLGQHGDFLA